MSGQPATAADRAWEALAVDIHANGNSVRDAIALHRPTIEAEVLGEAAIPQPAVIEGYANPDECADHIVEMYRAPSITDPAAPEYARLADPEQRP